ncbi:TolC family protein [Chryseobacterium gambrini]|uniref:TolC family protein n=1 Tax=Chryseobacterium gambrini TaxID=373672 RepID=UPI003D0B1E0E
MKEYLKFWYSLLGLLFCSTVSSQKLLTFEDCISIALENNLVLKNAHVNEQIAAYQLSNSKTKLLPSISASVGNNYSWGRGVDPNTNSYINQQFKSYSGNVGSNLMLFNGFSNIIAIKIAKQEVEVNKTTMQKIKNEITIDIASKFTNALYLQEMIKSNEDQIKSSAKQLELVQLKFEQGYIPESEVFKIKSQKASEELTFVNNKNLLSINLLDIKQLLNLPLEEEIILVSPKEKLFSKIENHSTDTDMIDHAVSINPSYLITKINEQKAKLNIASTKSSIYPTINSGFNLGSTYTNSNPFQNFRDQVNNNLSYGLSFSISIPVFSQLNNYYKIKESKLSYEKSKNDTQIERNRLSKVIIQAINDANASFTKYESSLLSYEFSQKSYEADLLKFDLGKISVNELLLTKNNFVNAQSQLIQAKYELLYNQSVTNFYMSNTFRLE